MRKVRRAPDGFNDALLGPQRKAAFEYALGLWSQRLPASYVGETIVVAAGTRSYLAAGALLAVAQSTSFFENFHGAMPETLYSVALANHLAKQDLNASQPEITVTVNEDIDTAALIFGVCGFYYQTDGQTGSDKYDIVSLIMHEIAHGPGFTSNIAADGSYSRTTLGTANPTIWDRFLEIGNGTDLAALTRGQRAQALVGGDLFWRGSRAIRNNGSQRPEIFAPPMHIQGRARRISMKARTPTNSSARS